VPIVLKSGSLNLLEPSGPVKDCFTFTFTVVVTVGADCSAEGEAGTKYRVHGPNKSFLSES
jgi:hypothetical protein